MLGILLLVLGLIIAAAIFRLGIDADWHWGAALFVAAIPVAFTLLFGVIGVVVSGLLLASLWKATA